MTFKLISLLSLIVCVSCSLNKNNFDDRIIGNWAIEEIEFNKKSYKNFLYSNVLIFKPNSNISIPETVHFIEDPNSTWKIIDSKKLVIESSNLAFKDTFNIKFIKSKEDKPTGLEIISDSIYIRAYNLLDFEK